MRINGYSGFVATYEPIARSDQNGAERSKDAAAVNQAGAVGGAFGVKSPDGKDIRATTKSEKGDKSKKEKNRSSESDVQDHVEISSYARARRR